MPKFCLSIIFATLCFSIPSVVLSVEHNDERIKNGDFGPTRNTDTLRGIAEKLGKRQGISTEKMLTALHQSNENISFKNTTDNLKSGLYLHIPTIDNGKHGKPKKLATIPLVPSLPINTSIVDNKTPESSEPPPTIKSGKVFADVSELDALKGQTQTLQSHLLILENKINLLEQSVNFLKNQNSILSDSLKSMSTQRPTTNSTVHELLRVFGILCLVLIFAMLALFFWQYWQKNKVRKPPVTKKSTPTVGNTTRTTTPRKTNTPPVFAEELQRNLRVETVIPPQEAIVDIDPSELSSFAEIDAYNSLSNLRKRNDTPIASPKPVSPLPLAEEPSRPVQPVMPSVESTPIYQEEIEDFLFDFDFSEPDSISRNKSNTANFQFQMDLTKADSSGKS